jgi:hypothetical protein
MKLKASKRKKNTTVITTLMDISNPKQSREELKMGTMSTQTRCKESSGKEV